MVFIQALPQTLRASKTAGIGLPVAASVTRLFLRSNFSVTVRSGAPPAISSSVGGKPFASIISFTGSSGAQVHSHTPSASALSGILGSGTFVWFGLKYVWSDLPPFHPLIIT